MRTPMLIPTLILGMVMFVFILSSLSMTALMYVLAVFVSGTCATYSGLCMLDYLNGRAKGPISTLLATIWMAAAVMVWVTMPKNSIDIRSRHDNVAETVEANQP